MELGNLIFGNSRGQYNVDRGWTTIFGTLLDKLNMGYHANYYDNNMFTIFPYYWSDCDCTGIEKHDSTCSLMKPNFYYKPTGFEINWYKYPFRDSYMNKNITRSEFMDIILKCIDSVKDI